MNWWIKKDYFYSDEWLDKKDFFFAKVPDGY